MSRLSTVSPLADFGTSSPKLRNAVFWMLRRVALVRTYVSEERSVFRLLDTDHVVPSSPILVTLMMEALRSSETSVLTRATRHNIAEDGFLQSNHRENRKSYSLKLVVQHEFKSYRKPT
jgi:DNA-binding transcriptional regulator PaaX